MSQFSPSRMSEPYRFVYSKRKSQNLGGITEHRSVLSSPAKRQIGGRQFVRRRFFSRFLCQLGQAPVARVIVDVDFAVCVCVRDCLVVCVNDAMYIPVGQRDGVKCRTASRRKFKGKFSCASGKCRNVGPASKGRYSIF